MNTEQSVGDLPTEDAITRLRWRADGLMHRIVIKSQEAISAVRDAAMKAIAGRGPDPDFVREDDERIMVPAHWVERMMRRQGPGPGSVSGGSKMLTALVALNTALLIGIGGWLLVTVVQHDKDIAVLKCQVDPQCRGVLRVQP